MKLPKIDNIVTTDWALDLCKYYKKWHLIDRINRNYDKTKPWKFDGASGIPDKEAAKIMGISEDALKYKCALPHDLEYMYGDPDSEEDRLREDYKLGLAVLRCGGTAFESETIFSFVRKLGKKELRLPFSWGGGWTKFELDIRRN